MVYAIILAAGRSERLGSDTPKQLLKIAGKTVLEHTLNEIHKCSLIDKIIIVTSETVQTYIEQELLKAGAFPKVVKVVRGGDTRMESSSIGVSASGAAPEDIILIHDVARPFINSRILRDNIEEAIKQGAVDTVSPVVDTIVEVNRENALISGIPDRRKLMSGQTPQTFRAEIILKAHQLASEDESLDKNGITDDCGLVLRYKLSNVACVIGDPSNIKITYPLDAQLADLIFQSRQEPIPAVSYKKVAEEIGGKNMLVIGASSGIGERIANLAEKLGARVIRWSRSSGIDVRDYGAVNKGIQKILDEYKQLHYVINTSGVLHKQRLQSMSHDELREEVETNLLGSMNVAKASIPYLRYTKGSLIFFASSSYTRGRAWYSAYSATKAAIVNFAQAIAEEEPFIKVNVVSPERTDTPMRWRNFGNEPKHSLLDPQAVAVATLQIITLESTGQVYAIRKSMEKELLEFI